MGTFTYFDYWYCKVIFENPRDILCLKEDSNEYRYDENQIHYPHDKLFKEVLDNKKEVIYFLNKELKLENTPNALKEEDIEKYNREFITKNFYKLESDIVYKMKNRNIFFLIEHQSKIDPMMAYRILKYNMAIIDSAIHKENIQKKGYKLPKIYPFIIYTGKKKWNMNHELESMQEKLEGTTQEKITYFKTVDINDYTKQELLEEKSLLSKIMLLEKVRNTDDIGTYMKEILSREMVEEDQYFLEIIIKSIFKNQISEHEYKDIMNLFKKRKESKKSMFEEIAEKWYQKYVEAPLQMVKKAQEGVKKEQEELKKEQEEVKKEQEEVKKEQEEVKKEQEELKKEQEGFQKEREEFEKEQAKLKKSEKEFENKKRQIMKEREEYKKIKKELEQLKSQYQA